MLQRLFSLCILTFPFFRRIRTESNSSGPDVGSTTAEGSEVMPSTAYSEDQPEKTEKNAEEMDWRDRLFTPRTMLILLTFINVVNNA